VRVSLSLFSFFYAFLSRFRPPFLSCPFVVKRGVSGKDYQTLIKLSTAATGLTYVRPILNRGWRIIRFQVESTPFARRTRSHHKLLNERSRSPRDLEKERSEVNPIVFSIHSSALQYANTAIRTCKTYFFSVS